MLRKSEHFSFYRGKIDQRVKSLTQILTKELEVRPEKSHQGGLRAARISVRLLNKLQKSTQVHIIFSDETDNSDFFSNQHFFFHRRVICS